MEELIETVVNEAVSRISDIPFDEQVYVYSELSDRMSKLSDQALLAEYRIRED